MKWIAIAIGVVVALVVLVVVIGVLLPRDHVATVSARITATPTAVWSAITQPENFITWRGDVTRVEMLTSTATGPSWREHSRHGPIAMGVDAVDPPKHLVTRILDENLPYGGRWEFDIAPEGQNDSRVTITERGWVSNPLFRFVSRFVVGHTSSLEAYLRALGKHFGTEPTPTVVAGRGT